jgi:hypothetical protein
MCLRRAPEKYIAGAALDRAALGHTSRSYPVRAMAAKPADNLEQTFDSSQNQQTIYGEINQAPRDCLYATSNA